MKDIAKVVYDMAKTNRVGRLIVGPNVIPVKITNIKHESMIDSSNTEFECLVVDPSASYVDTDKVAANPWADALNSVYGIMGGRSNGKSYDEYQAMKDQLRKGCKLVPVGSGGAWAAMAYRATEKKSGDRPWGWGVPGIDKVIFSNPATIVFWSDGEKTVVKCQNGEAYDPEKGLAMAISKRALGNKGNYCNVFNKQLSEGQENSTPEQFNSEVCHVQAYDDLWDKFRNEVGHTNNAHAILASVVNYKKATKAQILNAVNDAIKHLDRLKRDDN